MWRGAHGRLAAIAVLAGGLSTCATPPKPVADDEEMHHPGCGGNFPPLERERLTGLIEKAVLESCGPMAVSEERYGEIRIVLREHADGYDMPLVETEKGDDLIGEIRRCVEEAARRAIPPDPYGRHDAYYAFVQGLTIDIWLGTPPPLLPPTPAAIDQWFAATRSQPARERFAAQLPAEVALEDDGCLSMPRRLPFTARAESWLAAVGTPVDAFWGLLLWDLAPYRHGRRAYLRGEQTMLFHQDVDIDRSRPEVCLMPLDQRLREEIQARVAKRGTCWEGDLPEVLLHPRTGFPGGRRFTTVAVASGRACALDDKGVPACCGFTLGDELPAGPFATITVGSQYACGLTPDGTIRCWGSNAPAGGAEVPGPYARISIGGRTLCASRRDTGALECWYANRPTVVTERREKVRDVKVVEHDLCARLEDGRVVCRGDGDTFGGWSQLGGLFRTFAASDDNVCGVTTAGDGIRCRRDRSAWTLDARGGRVTPAAGGLGEPSDVVLSRGDGCVLYRSGKIACWGSPAAHRWDGAYRAIAGGDDRVCAVTTDGRVDCDRDWPSGQMRTAQQQ